MGIVRSRPTGNFLVVPAELIDDQNLSLEALGGLIRILRLPRDWSIRVAHVEKKLWRCGENRRKRLFREIMEAGYMRRSRGRDEQGRLEWFYDFFDDLTIGSFSTDGSSTDGSSTDGKRPYIYKTDKNKTDKNKKHTQNDDVCAPGLTDEACKIFAAAIKKGRVKENPAAYLKSLIPGYKGLVTDAQAQAALARGEALAGQGLERKKIQDELKRQEIFLKQGDREAASKIQFLRERLGGLAAQSA